MLEYVTPRMRRVSRNISSVGSAIKTVGHASHEACEYRNEQYLYKTQ